MDDQIKMYYVDNRSSIVHARKLERCALQHKTGDGDNTMFKSKRGTLMIPYYELHFSIW